MRLRKTLILIFCFINTLAYSQNQGRTFTMRGVDEKTLIDKPFPKFTFVKDSVILTNEKLAGKVVYINFWFTACRPCMDEMPMLNWLYNRFKMDTNFVFISLTFDGIEKVEKIKDRFNIKYNVYSISSHETSMLNRTQSFPAHVILDKKGITKSFETGIMGPNQTKKRISKLLSGG